MGIPSVWRRPPHRVENHIICVVFTTFLAQVHQQQRRVFCKSLSNFSLFFFSGLSGHSQFPFSFCFCFLSPFFCIVHFALPCCFQCKPLLSWFHCTILVHFVNPDLFLFNIFIIFHRSHRQRGHIKITILVPRLFSFPIAFKNFIQFSGEKVEFRR